MPGSAVAPPAAAEAGGSPPADRAALQAALDAVHAAGMPGLFAEVREGNWVWLGTSGVADIGTGRRCAHAPMVRAPDRQPDQDFVATTTLQLVGEGRIGLDEPIARYVADLVPADLAGQVTVRMLLQHTSDWHVGVRGRAPSAPLFECLHRSQRPQMLAMPADREDGAQFGQLVGGFAEVEALVEVSGREGLGGGGDGLQGP